MTEEIKTTTEVPAIKPRRKPGRKPKPKLAPAPKVDKFAGLTARKCCDACTAERCVISTVAACKHPFTSGDSGCGPVTMKNREEARKYIRIKELEAA